ncbi:MAG: hypothetical protein JO015_05065 [Verrucomicrobia bacterium]|nr:hypothetical protein [Verrucomicrobiota bacterium]
MNPILQGLYHGSNVSTGQGFSESVIPDLLPGAAALEYSFIRTAPQGGWTPSGPGGDPQSPSPG